ncbi:MAG: hypothetical protein WAR37_04240 [Candidatus Microsaccharimonas sp.]
MDKDHRLDAPDDENLRSIDQLSDRSALSSIYPEAHDRWEGTIMSEQARSDKRDKEQQNITQSIRKWFIVIGVLAPLPFIIASLLAMAGYQYGPLIDKTLIVIPFAIAALVWLLLSVYFVRKLYAIFYNHALSATPYYIVLLILLSLSLHLVYSLTAPYHSQDPVINTFITSVAVVGVSVILSGVLLVVWTSLRIKAQIKFVFIFVLALLLASSSVTTWLT